jgi:hypothetical protein
MPQFIINRGGAYNIYSTIVDAPLFNDAFTLAELRQYILDEHGRMGLDGLPRRLERANKTGTSEHNSSLEGSIFLNRAGPGESELPVDEFVAQYLTLKEDDQ